MTEVHADLIISVQLPACQLPSVTEIEFFDVLRKCPKSGAYLDPRCRLKSPGLVSALLNKISHSQDVCW